MLTDESSLVSNLQVLPPLTDGCDHNQIAFTVHFSNRQQALNKALSYTKGNYYTINHILANTNWVAVFIDTANTNALYEKLVSVFLNLIKIYVPQTKIRTNQFPFHIQKIIKYREKLFPKVFDKFRLASSKMESEQNLIKIEKRHFYLTNRLNTSIITFHNN